MVPVRPELGAIAIGVIGITGVSLVASGIVKWPFSIIMLTVLYVIIILHGFYTSRRLNA
jgi:uncharacterized membrane protein YuzA (DUF378 family)